MKALTLFVCVLIVLNCRGQERLKPTELLKKELAEIYRTDQLYREEMAKINSTDLKIVDLVHKQDKIDSIN